jgi:hypothetical protein
MKKVGHRYNEYIKLHTNRKSFLANIKMKPSVIQMLIQLLTIAMIFYPYEVYAGDLRGRVNTTNAFVKYPYPLINAPVVLLKENQGRWIKVSQTYTNSSGDYFFRSIPPGKYQIEVSNQRYTFVVTSASFQDITPILIRK